jgi:hypothetical protein
MKKSTKISLLLLAVFLGGLSARAQSTAFTYHGRLNNNGAPVTGAYDMQFSVYDAEDAGLLVAGPVPANALDVNNGLFSARINFGAGVFTGPPRWLEISVSPAGTGNFQKLSPRQELTSSPYAIRAQSAETAATAADVANGSVVKSLNNLRDNLTLSAGANVTITPSGNTLTIASAGSGGSGIWSVNNNNAYYNAGNVGIGTTTPGFRLDVQSSAVLGSSFKGTALGPSGLVHIENTSAPTSWNFGVEPGSGWAGGPAGAFYIDQYLVGPRLAITPTGAVGIGTPNPTSKLTVAAASDDTRYGIEHTDGTVRLGTYIGPSFGVPGGWLGTVSNHKLHFFVNDGSPSVTIDTAGSVGIGTTAPQATLHLYEPASVSQRIETGGGVNAWSRTEYANANGQWIVGTSRSFNGDQFYIHRLGAPAITFGIQPNGDAYLQGTMNCKVLTITGGADIAEPFKMSSSEIPKGSVVVIDEENPGHLKLSSEAYDAHVAGVVSGANGIKPGISLHQEGSIEGGENVALSGRVYVQADASFGVIKPGDLLTTSDTPGHAMKVSDHTKAQGAILGKAMSGLKEGKGMVLVLVTLQ